MLKKCTLAVFTSLMFMGMAQAAPLLGTTASFANSSFCKTYGCTLVARDTLSATLTEYRYALGSTCKCDSTIISVMRSSNTVVSIGFVQGAQDYIFSDDPQDKRTLQAARLVEVASGAKLNNTQLFALDKRCQDQNTIYTKEVRLPLSSIGKRSTLVCNLTFGEYEGAWRFSLRVF